MKKGNEKRREKKKLTCCFRFFTCVSFFFFFGEAEKSLKNLILYCCPNNEDIFPLNNKNMIPLFVAYNSSLIPTLLTCAFSFSFFPHTHSVAHTHSVGEVMSIKFMIWFLLFSVFFYFYFNSDFVFQPYFIKADPEECF